MPEKVVVIFHNIGGYHAARLRASQAMAQANGFTLTAIQETDKANEHPWGNLADEITFPLITLLPAKEASHPGDLNPQSPAAAQRLPKYLDQIQPDILVIPGWGFPIARTALQWGRKKRIPTILMSESKWDDEPRRWWKEKLKSFLYIRQFQAALVGGNLHKDYLVRLGMAKEAIFWGYDVVDNQYFTEKSQQIRQNPQITRKKYPQIPSVPYFIAVTRFIPRKNILLLLKAYNCYRQQAHASPWELVLCGSGSDEATIKQFIQAENLNDVVHLPGFVSYQDIPAWYALAAAFIHPALQEQWGLVVNEAMAAGLPVLVSNRCGCFPELVLEGVNGFGFDPEDQQQLTNLMLKISSGKVDLYSMGQAALRHIQKYFPDYFAQGLKQAIKYATNQRS
jgi:1,2-diacylglycerol 3-alpha-glucosyltransferase